MITILGFSDLDFHISGSWYLHLICILLILIFSLFIYHITLPKVSKPKKIFLALIRSVILISILLLIFEPTLSFISERKNEKYNYIFIDNSNSLAANDSTKNIQRINLLFDKLKSLNEGKNKFFLFAEKVDSLENITDLKLDKSSTNFSSLYSFIKKRKNDIDKTVIISDGIITQGEDPSYYFEKLQVKLFTIGIGDTSRQKDVSIENVVYNQNIFVNKETQIDASVLSKYFDNQELTVFFYDENQLIEKRNIKLNSSGLNKISFKYKPNKIGERRLKIEVTQLTSEISYANNIKTFFINVISSKIKVGLISSSPNSDLSSISTALKQNPEYEIYKYIQVDKNKIWKEPTNLKLDSIDVFFLLNFPTSSTSSEDISNVFNQIAKGKPFFISISNYTDFNKLKLFEKYLPLSFKNISNETQKIQAQVNVNEFTSNFSQVSSAPNIWYNLAPIDQVNFLSVLKPESKILVNSRLKDTELDNPLIAIRNIGNQRSMIFNGYNFWYWQLQNAESSFQFYNNFIIEAAKWLGQLKIKKYFSLSANKKIFNNGEPIELTAELFDQSINPIDTSNVIVKIKNQNLSEDINLQSKGNGIYQAEYNASTSGEILFEAENSYYNDANKTAKERIFINNIQAEKVITKMDADFLKHLAYLTNGKYTYIDNAESIMNEIQVINSNNDSHIDKHEIDIWNNRNMLLLIISLFTIEWSIRKRIGMI